MRDFLQYILCEVKSKRLSKIDGINLIRQFQTQISSNKPDFLHPFLHENTSDFSEQRFSSTFTGQEFFLADHVVKGQRILPGVAYLEMVRAAVEQAVRGIKEGELRIRLKDVVWSRPIAVGEHPLDVHIGLYPEENGEITYKIYRKAITDDVEAVVHSQGAIILTPITEVPVVDLKSIQSECSQRSLSSSQCYEAFKAMGLDYGPGHQGIEKVYIGQGQVLAKLSLPYSIVHTQDQFVLHPSLMDAALQASIGLIGVDTFKLALPFTLQELEIFYRCTPNMWAFIRYSNDSNAEDKVQKFDIDVCDANGRVCVRMKGFIARIIEWEVNPGRFSENLGTLLLEAIYIERGVVQGAIEPDYTQHLVLLCELGGVSRKSIESQMNGVQCLILQAEQEAIGERFQIYAVQVFEQIQRILKDKSNSKVLIQIVVLGQGEQQVFNGFSGMLKTAQLENPKISGQVIEMESNEDSEQIVKKLKENSCSPIDNQIRYKDGKRWTIGWNEIEDLQEIVKTPWRSLGVYLITGGAGGLGFIFAQEIVRNVKNITLILTGRSPLNEKKQAQIKELEELGAQVKYRQVDVTDKKAVTGLIQSIEADHGNLNGIIHSAGIVRDNFIIKKSKEELREVLDPKVSGLVNLDEASKDVGLDFFILFSSMAGSIGNPGQVDYATGNAFMDAYAKYRNVLVAEKKRQGQTLSINWPLWKDGGMHVDVEIEKLMLKNMGIIPMQTSTGILALYQSLTYGKEHVMVMEGNKKRMMERILSITSSPAVVQLEKEYGISNLQVNSGLLREKTLHQLKVLFGEITKLGIERIDPDEPWERYGIDSVIMIQIIQKLVDVFKNLTKTLLFEYQTLADLADYLLADYRQECIQWTKLGEKGQVVVEASLDAKGAAPTPVKARGKWIQNQQKDKNVKELKQQDDIAIVGISGKFPMAEDVHDFWKNLVEGKDCITEIPKERWDWQEYYGDSVKEANKTNIKWGGFINGVDEFDPLFFGISPKEAELMDPQQRLLLTSVWHALEDAGNTPREMSKSPTGVFVAAGSSEYTDAVAIFQNNSLSLTSTAPALLPTRISYALNLHGPSEYYDTACSSTLVALHRAVQAIHSGECEQAIVGAVNLLLSPRGFIGSDLMGYLSPEGKAKPFQAGANGYVRSEGVGVIIIKPLQKAVSDQDKIYAVVKGTGVSHGGKGMSLTAPNANGMKAAMIQAYQAAKIDPRTVSYIEAHGIASLLGDGIEINALKAGYQELAASQPQNVEVNTPCYISSLKSSIGHGEVASGMTALIKTILAMHHKLIPGIPQFTTLSEYISLEESPFKISAENHEWELLKDIYGNSMPRRASINSYGFSGVNAHVVLEEHTPLKEERIPIQGTTSPQILVFSAKNPEQLQALVRQMLDFVEFQKEISLSNMAYTLQVGREAMAFRVVMVVCDTEELIRSLKDYLESSNKRAEIESSLPIYTGEVEESHMLIRRLFSGEIGDNIFQLFFAENNMEKVAIYWTQGGVIPWELLHEGENVQKISLPTYPFAKEQYWIASNKLQYSPKVLNQQFTDQTQKIINPKNSIQENIQDYIVQFLSRELNYGQNQIKPNKNIQDYGIDSIMGMKLMRGFEKQFNIHVSGREMLTYGTIKSLSDHLARKIEELNKQEINVKNELETNSKISKHLNNLGEAQSPLSEGQKGLWMLQKVSPETSSYNIPLCFRVFEKVNIDKFKQACHFILEEHPILTSVIEEDSDGVPYQTIESSRPLTFQQEDISNLKCSEILSYLREKAKEPFCLENGSLMRVHLLFRSEAEYIVLITIHHIVFDGASSVLLMTTLLNAYQELAKDRNPIPNSSLASYYDFIEWEHKMLISKEGEEHRSYWRQQLSGNLPILEIPADRPRFSSRSDIGETYTNLLTPELSKKIKSFAQSQHLNSSIVFLGIFKLLLHRYTGQEDIIVGMPTMGRIQEGFDSLIGYFVNMIPMRSQVEGTKSFSKFIRELQVTVVDGLDHAYPFPSLVRDLNIPRTSLNAPIFQVAFLYQNFLHPTGLKEWQSKLPIEFVEGIHQEGEYEFGLEVYEQEERFVLTIKYNSDLFDLSTITRMMGHYAKLTEEIIDDPSVALEEYSLLSKEEEITLTDWNETHADYPSDKCFHELFEKQAQKTPNTIAVVYEEGCLTYKELDERSSQMAIYLQKLGVFPDCLVGICVERSLEMIVGLLAILKAGGAYVPLDPHYPKERLEYMLQDSKASFLLTQSKLLGKISPLIEGNIKTIVLDKDRHEIEQEVKVEDTLKREVQSNHLAYVIYTSGSTGKPKGVMIPHRALTNFLISMGDRPGIHSQDRLLAVTTYCFDIAGLEFYLPLINGAQCYICSSEKAKDVEKLKREIQRNKPTIMQATPVTWTMLFHAGWKNEERVKILCGGEALPERLKQYFIDTNSDAWNMFGPTETTIWSTVQHIKKEESITIGKPIANTKIYILDNNGKSTPIGIPGELCIAGDGLARGYLNKPVLTAEKFIPNPFNLVTQLYKTGDLARWLADGNIEFLGRNDQQVKIRGFRIELGEIESQLKNHPEIQESVVIVNEQEGIKQLIAYYVRTNPGRDKASLSLPKLREYLKSNLPDYMIPVLFVEVDSIPLTPNGKIDRKDLMNRKIVLTGTKKTFSPPSEIEEKILEIWKAVLHNDNINIEDGFFEVGGDSLLAVAVAERIKKKLKCDFNVTTLFEYTNIKSISKYIAENKDAIAVSYEEGCARHFKQQDAIAIVGISGKFPMAEDVHELWKNLVEGKDCITEIPKERWDWQKYYGDSTKEVNKTKIKWGGFINGVEYFDPLFFGISPKEAEMMDPRQRLLMTYVWHAIEDTGITPKEISKGSTGVFVAAGPSEYTDAIDVKNSSFFLTSIAPTVLPARISHALNLHGPSEYYDTACSSTLVALHRAVQAIHSGECEQAIVGAVNLLISPKAFIYLDLMGYLSPEGKGKPFQTGANGYVRSEGVGVIIIKPLQKAINDQDKIYAVVKGTGVSHGGKGMSLTAPNANGMKAAMVQAYQAAKIDPRTVSYIEAHGIASPLGDGIEINALKAGYQELAASQPQNVEVNTPCYISSLKSSIGHGEVASGMTALIKTILAMHHKLIPGIPQFTTLSEYISLEESPFKISAENHEWESLKDIYGNCLPRRASINSYGFSGVNAHVILEEYTHWQEEVIPIQEITSPQIVVFSAKNPEQLETLVQQMLDFIEFQKEISLLNIAYTLQVGREAMSCRVAMVVRDREELIRGLKDYLNLSEKGAEIECSLPIFTGDVKESHLVISRLFSGEIGENVMQLFLAENNLDNIAIYWTQGGVIPWKLLHEGEKVKKISLPTYPFAKEQYWIASNKLQYNPKVLNQQLKDQPQESLINPENSIQENIQDYIVQFLSQELNYGQELIKLNQNIQDYGVDSIIGLKLMRSLEKQFNIQISGREMLMYGTIKSLSDHLSEKLTELGEQEITVNNQLEAKDQKKNECIEGQGMEALEKFRQGVLTLEEIENLIDKGEII